MQSGSLLLAGADISSGRHPITLTALDEDLNIMSLEKWDIPQALLCMQLFKDISVTMRRFSSKAATSAFLDFKKQIAQAGTSHCVDQC